MDQNLVPNGDFGRLSYSVCFSDVYRMRVSTEPAEAAKPSMSHSHMDRLNRFKMVRHQRVSRSLSLCL